jgi:hypothetical protein
MSTATKLTYLNTTKGLIKDTINLTGANITNDTFRSYAQKLKLGLINALNDNGETIFNNLEKVSGKGSNLSLTPTYEAPIGLKGLYGNTSQSGTPTPSSPIPIQSVTGNQNVVISNSSSSNTYEVNLGNEFDVGVSTGTGNGVNVSYNKNIMTFNGTTTGNGNVVPVTSLGTFEAGTYIFKFKKISGTTATNKGNAIYIRDNNNNALVDKTINDISSYTQEITLAQTTELKVQFYVAGGGGMIFNSLVIGFSLMNKSTAIELNKIGTYEDSIKKSTGKNLFDKDNANVLNGNLADGGTLSSTNNARTLYIPCKNNTTYTISKLQAVYFRVAQFTNVPQIGDSYISRTKDDLANSITFTTTTGNYLAVTYWYNTSTYTEQQVLDSLMIQEGSTALPYEPYGKVWYITKNIGKYTFTGNEDWRIHSSGCFYDKSNTYNTLNGVVATNSTSISPITCTHFVSKTSVEVFNNNNVGICTASDNTSNPRISNPSITDVTAFKTWLSTNNVTMYYALKTPIYEVITNTTLIEQLETLSKAKSKNGTTNIVITSQDLAMLMDVSVIKGDE